MKPSCKVVMISGIMAVLMSMLFCSCNVPDPVPTATPTPDWTATPVPPTPTPTQRPTATPTPVPEHLKIRQEELNGTKLVLRCSLDGKVRQKLEDLVKQFNEENETGVTIQIEQAYAAEELSEILSSSKTETDLVISGSAWLHSKNTDNALLMDLSDFINSTDLGLSSGDIDPLMPVMLETENTAGRFYALPLWTEPAFLFYNKTWAIELGYPETPADLASFADQACAAGKANYADKDASKHGTGGWIVSSAPEDVMSWLMVFAQNGETPEDILISETGDAFTDAASWLRNLYDNGCAWTSRVKEPYDYFANRYALFYSGTYSDAERQFNAFENSEDHGFDNWDLIVYPTKTTGTGKTDPRIFSDVVSVAIPLRADPKHANAAWHFIRWLYSEDHAAELALSAGGWPVQDTDSITKLYRQSGKDKLYQTLSYRQYQANRFADENRLTDQLVLSDGFAYIFNPSAKPEEIPGIWEQIGSLIAEINHASHIPESLSSENNTKQE